MKIVIKIITKLLNVYAILWTLASLYAQFQNVMEFEEFDTISITAACMVIGGGLMVLAFLFFTLFDRRTK